MNGKGSVNFSDAQIVTAGTTDVIGTRHLVQSEVGAFAFRMSGGNRRHATREVTQGGGVGSAVDLGTLRRLALRVKPALMETIGRLVSTHENGRRNRFALIVTGTQEQRKAVSLGTRNTTLYSSTRTLPEPKKRRSHRNRLWGYLSPPEYIVLKFL